MSDTVAKKSEPGFKIESAISESFLDTLEELNKGKKFKEIVEKFDEAVTPITRKTRRTEARAWFVMGSALMRQGRRDDAQLCFEAALALHSENIWVMAEMADLLAPVNPKLAELYYRQALFREQGSRIIARAVAFASRTKSRNFYDELCETDVSRGGRYYEAWVDAATSFSDIGMLKKLRDDLEEDKDNYRFSTFYGLAATELDSSQYWDEFYKMASTSIRGRRDTPLNEHFVTSNYLLQELTEAAKPMFDIEEAVMIDAGTGMGFVAEAFSPHFDMIHAVDVSPVAIAEAGKTCDECDNVALHTGEIIGWLREQGAGSARLITDLFTHQSMDPANLGLLLAEYRRVLAPGGRLILAFNLNTPQKGKAFNSQLSMIDEAGLDAKLLEAGFKHESKPIKRGSIIVAEHDQ